jgi:hypothetical protein
MGINSLSRRKHVDPRCFWCHQSTPEETGYRGTDHTQGLPPGTGVVVCGPGCPAKPDGETVYRRFAGSPR